VDLDKLDLDKLDLDKPDLDRRDPDRVVPARVAQDPVDRVSPSSSADKVLPAHRGSKVLAARLDSKDFLDSKAFRSKVARDRKGCPVSRAGPINSATGAPPPVRKAHE
jgi:hypothetical protein